MIDAAVDIDPISDLSAETRSNYDMMRVLPDGRICGVHRLMYHWTMQIGIDEVGYQDRYCYASRDLAIASMLAWDGVGDPVGWHRHPATGRRRDLQTGREWIAR